MKTKALITLILMLLVGCETTDETVVPNTLLGNPDIPHKEIRGFYPGTQWDEVKNIPFDGYVILRGEINEDRTIKLKGIQSSYPDERRNELAMKFAKNAMLSPVSVGSRVRPSAKIYVVFYETHSNPNRALVFAKQTRVVMGSASVGGTQYMTYWTY